MTRHNGLILTWFLLLALLATTVRADTDQAIFAGGCFWCMEADFEKRQGVVSVVSGYTGGHVENPDYKAVTAGKSGHYEAVLVDFDPAIVSYRELLELYWVNIDPFDDKGQFCDKGSSYRSAIFPLNDEQRELAESSMAWAQQQLGSKHSLATAILDAGKFYPAEDYHQDYYKKNSVRYNYYRWSCGRDQRLEAVWGQRD